MTNERKILSLPSKRAPSQPTVKYKTRTLEDHKAAFLNSNNPHEFVSDESPEDPNSLSAVLREIMERQVVNVDEVKTYTKRIASITENNCSVAAAYAVISRLMGYSGWQDVLQRKSANGDFTNLNFGKTDTNLKLFGQKDSGFSNKRMKIDALDSMTKGTRRPLLRTVFMYELRIRYNDDALRELFDQTLVALANAVQRTQPAEDLETQTRYYIRVDPSNPDIYRLYCRESNKDKFDNYDMVCYVELLIDHTSRWKNILHFGTDIHHTKWDINEERNLQTK